MRIDGKAEGIRQSMSWLHTWTGIALGWLMYVVFFTGTLSYFLDEINLWMKPELHASVPDAGTAATALAGMQLIAPKATTWTIGLPNERRTTVEASWRVAGERATGRAGLKRAELDAATGEQIKPRETRGGSFLYRFHFELHAMSRDLARWLVGIATLFMFAAIVSGVITHKKIFTDFFTFRPRKGQRSWLDAHNATAVLALPFHFVITFSGLLLLIFTLMPWAIDAAYDGDRQAYAAERRGGQAGAQQAARPGGQGGEEGQRGARRRGGDGGHEAAPDLAAALPAMLAQAQQQWPGKPVGSIIVNRPGRADATVELREHGSDSLSTRGAARRLLFSASGKLVEQADAPAPSVARGIFNVMTATHLGSFAGPVLRWLLFLSGVAGTAMIATGLVLWVVKRLPERRKLGRTPWGHRLVEVSNIAVITGLALATAAYFWLNRLLPADLVQRSSWEIQGFFIVWLLGLLHAALRPARQAWLEQCLAVSVLYCLLPVLNPLTGGHGVASAWHFGQMSLVGFDLAMLAIGLLFAYIARHLMRRSRLAARAAAGSAPAAGTQVAP